ncbi:helix-turn-helix domain-containing protein [Bradyrhizobium jicamae]|uniref:helix-turn-helix domain-containing protein n=1 Tax=Bradyrhizobium jicamae TaxID=280332 RepID=UPI00201380CB|nr:helix-turn-helix domain-containing protein [Bradyrhizobium jicamae]
MKSPRALRYPGRRPGYTRAQLELVRKMLDEDATVVEIALATGLSKPCVYRIRRDPAAAEASLAKWGD